MRPVVLALVLAVVGRAEFSPESDLGYRLNRFAEAYNVFTEQLMAGQFDLRSAKKLSQLWRDVETSGAWPRSK